MDSVKELLDKIWDEFEKNGLFPTSGKHQKWMPIDHIDSTCWNVSKTEDGYRFHITIDGEKAGLKFREYTENDDEDGDGEERDFHDPRDEKFLDPKIKKIFKGLNFKDVQVSMVGWQSYWDYDVHYKILVRYRK